MAWGALVKTVAKGAVKKAATGAIKKKVGGKGKKMAKKMMDAKKEKDNSSAIVVREKSTALIPIDKASSDGDSSSIQKSESSSSPLERIRSTLLDIIETLKKRRKLVLNKSRKDRVQADKEKKAKREGLLEKMKSGGKKMLSNVKAAATGWWERLQKFLLMTMLGALVLSIKNNWEAIKKQIDKVVKFVQDLWNFMEPILTPLFEGLSWVVKQWTEMGSELIGLSKDKPKVEKETDNLSEDLNKLKSAGDAVTGKFQEAVDGVKDYEKKKFGDIVKEGGIDDSVSPDDDKQSGKTKDQVQKIETQLADAKTRLVKYEKEGDHSKIEGVTKKIKSYENRLSKMKKYEEGAVPVSKTGPAVVHKGEVIIPAPVVNQVGGPMNVVKFMEIGLGGGTEGLGALTESAKTKTISSAVGDFFSGDDGESKRLKEDTNRGSVIADLSNHLPPIMMEKMEKTLTTIKEQTEYEDPSPSTIIIRVPTSSPQSGGGGGSETMVIPVGATPKDTLNRYVNAVIQKALF